MKQYNTVMSVIPGGCTKFLQPLDVCINKRFKLFFGELYDNWFQKGEFIYTSSGKIKAPVSCNKSNGLHKHGKSIYSCHKFI